MKKKMISKESNDELDEFIHQGEAVPMTIPILKKRVWVSVKDELDPQGHRWISIDKWMPLGSLHRFQDYTWISIDDGEDEEDWVPFEDMIDIHDDDQDDDDSST